MTDCTRNWILFRARTSFILLVSTNHHFCEEFLEPQGSCLVENPLQQPARCDLDSLRERQHPNACNKELKERTFPTDHRRCRPTLRVAVSVFVMLTTLDDEYRLIVNQNLIASFSQPIVLCHRVFEHRIADLFS